MEQTSNSNVEDLQNTILATFIKLVACGNDYESPNSSYEGGIKVKKENLNDSFEVKEEYSDTDIKNKLDSNLLRTGVTDSFKSTQYDNMKPTDDNHETSRNLLNNVGSSYLPEPDTSCEDRNTGDPLFISQNNNSTETERNCYKSHAMTNVEQKRTHTGEKYECDTHTDGKSYECHKAIKKKDILRNLLPHTGNKLYACDICGKTYTRNANLVTHKLTHTSEKSYVCEVCNKGFIENSGLVRHKLLHTSEKSYECDVCYKKFQINANLEVHKRIHTGEKPFVCDVCCKAFTHKTTLVRHKLLHTGEKPYQCDVCDRVFTLQASVVRHKQIHADKLFKCGLCDKACVRRVDLETHQRIHTGEKPYVCELCHKAYTRRAALGKHKAIHRS